MVICIRRNAFAAASILLIFDFLTMLIIDEREPLNINRRGMLYETSKMDLELR